MVTLLGEAAVVATSILASVECRVAFNRMMRDGRLAKHEERRANRSFVAHWNDYVRLDLDPALAESAVRLARAYAVRSADAIHLASALRFGGNDTRRVRFASWDGRLWEAARAAGFEMVPTGRP